MQKSAFQILKQNVETVCHEVDQSLILTEPLTRPIPLQLDEAMVFQGYTFFCLQG